MGSQEGPNLPQIESNETRKRIRSMCLHRPNMGLGPKWAQQHGPHIPPALPTDTSNRHIPPCSHSSHPGSRCRATKWPEHAVNSWHQLRSLELRTVAVSGWPGCSRTWLERLPNLVIHDRWSTLAPHLKEIFKTHNFRNCTGCTQRQSGMSGTLPPGAPSLSHMEYCKSNSFPSRSRFVQQLRKLIFKYTCIYKRLHPRGSLSHAWRCSICSLLSSCFPFIIFLCALSALHFGLCKQWPSKGQEQQMMEMKNGPTISRVQFMPTKKPLKATCAHKYIHACIYVILWFVLLCSVPVWYGNVYMYV